MWSEEHPLGLQPSLVEPQKTTSGDAILFSDDRVVGGSRVKSCHWPATLFIFAKKGEKAFGCTASLVHPEIIITAGHCIKGTDEVKIASGDGFYGDDKATLKWRKQKYCRIHPQWKDNKNDRGKDFAYCKLAEPVLDIPPTPILMGCELDALVKDMDVTVVGYGNIDPSGKPANTAKHEIITKYRGISEYQEALVGLPGKGPLTGDSGGPVYLKLPADKFGEDAGWRVFGVTSVSARFKANGEGYFGLMHRYVKIVEQDSGIDITPCTDADGKWNPTSDCKSAPLEPHKASGDWVKGCTSAPSGGFIASCGDPYRDKEAPKVQIESPKDDEVFELGDKIKVVVKATDDDKIKSLVLKVGGTEIDKAKEVSDSSYTFVLENLKEGEHELVAVATDRSKNEGKSETLKLVVKDSDAGTSSGGSSDTEGSSSSETESEMGPEESTSETVDSSDDNKDTQSSKDENSKDSDHTESSDEDSDEDSSDAGQDKIVRTRSCAMTGTSSTAPAMFLFGLLSWFRRRNHQRKALR